MLKYLDRRDGLFPSHSISKARNIFLSANLERSVTEHEREYFPLCFRFSMLRKQSVSSFIFMILFLFSYSSAVIALSDNAIQRKNSLFMHRISLVEELYKTNQILIMEESKINQIPRVKEKYTRQQIESGKVLIELFKNPLFSPHEIYRIAHEEIEDAEEEGEKLSDQIKQNIFQRIFEEKAGKIDSQVIEGVAVALTPGQPQKVVKLFLKLAHFKEYVPHIFLESQHLTEEFLKNKNVIKPKNREFQFSKIKIASVDFSHTLQYELTEDSKEFLIQTPQGLQKKSLPYMTISWEISPQFMSDPVYGPKGVLMNNGVLLIYPFVTENGAIDFSQSIIVYHIYIKVDPLNALMQILSNIFKDSIAKSIIHDLTYAMRKEASHP